MERRARRDEPGSRRLAAGLATTLAVSILLAASATAVAEPELPAPTRLYEAPPTFLLLPLRGDRVTVYYTPGSLDRAANLQGRLELELRAFERWSGERLEIRAYALSRREWEEAGYDLPYGLPLRVGERGLAAPAEGDEGTVGLWSALLDGKLPQLAGLPLRGTPQQASTMLLADVVAQVLVAEILVDAVGLAGDRPWVRGLMSQLAARDFTRRHDPQRQDDLDAMYALLARPHPYGEMSARDYGPDVGLRDWLWFQAQFHRGAGAILDKEGKGALKRMKKLRSKEGALTGARLLRRYRALDAWFHETFSAVSLRRG